MNIKIKAGLMVVGIVGIATGTAVVLKEVTAYLTPERLTTGVTILVVSILLYTMYSIILSKLEIDERYELGLKKILDKKFD
jgi:glucose uptake protein GlcU